MEKSPRNLYTESSNKTESHELLALPSGMDNKPDSQRDIFTAEFVSIDMMYAYQAENVRRQIEMQPEIDYDLLLREVTLPPEK